MAKEVPEPTSPKSFPSLQGLEADPTTLLLPKGIAIQTNKSIQTPSLATDLKDTEDNLLYLPSSIFLWAMIRLSCRKMTRQADLYLL